MDHAEAQAFAKQWVKDWNAHDVDALLEHFTDDVVFTSPVAIRIFGGDGVLRGKEVLRKYWSEGVRLIPDLHFEVLALYPPESAWLRIPRAEVVTATASPSPTEGLPFCSPASEAQ
jgi:hypothetical protein